MTARKPRLLDGWPPVLRFRVCRGEVRRFTQQQLLKQGSEEFEDNLFLAGEITRLENIVKDVLAFARPSDPQFMSVKATQPLRELVPLLEPGLRASNIVLKEEYLADPCLRADVAQLLTDSSLQPDAVEWLQQQRWPGNVRELANVLRQGLLLLCDTID